MLTAFVLPGGRPLRSVRLACGFLVLSVGLLVGVTGCDSKSKDPANSVTGKVSLGGQQVDGEVVFVGTDGKQVPGPIKPDGTYIIVDPPQGEVKILVRPMGGGVGGAAVIQPKDAPAMGGKNAPPAKYHSVTTTDLKYTVTSGKQKYDIELKQ